MKQKALITFATLIFLIAKYSFAQTLPNVQSNNIRSPANLMIDGKATEWGDKFQAYNKAVDVFYTIANDDKNLYLIVNATNPRIIQKIIYVGLTFTLNGNGKKNINDENNISVTYPLLNTKEGVLIIYNARDISYNSGTHLTNSDSTLKKVTAKQIDSTIKIANSLLIKNAKEIKINGVNKMKDSSISLYNEEGIRVASAFSNDGAYTYEVAIPLNYLHAPIGNALNFSYNIQIKGRDEKPKKGMVVHYYYRNGHPIDADADIDSTTDFWGEYTLAKKP